MNHTLYTVTYIPKYPINLHLIADYSFFSPFLFKHSIQGVKLHWEEKKIARIATFQEYISH